MDAFDHTFHIESKPKQKTKKKNEDLNRLKKYLNSFSFSDYEIEREERRAFHSKINGYLCSDFLKM